MKNLRADGGSHLDVWADGDAHGEVGPNSEGTSAPRMNGEGDGITNMAAEIGRLRDALEERQGQLARAWRQISELRHDVVDLTRKLEQEHQFSFYDALTHLPNRRLLMDRFNQAIAAGARQSNRKMALLFVDLDGFKRINDSLGHANGDQLLRKVAERLIACVRKSDTVCRYGGDEFVVLLTNVANQESAHSAAANMRKRIAKPFLLGEATVHVTASIGVAIYPIDGSQYENLVVLSDIAMFAEKAQRSV